VEVAPGFGPAIRLAGLLADTQLWNVPVCFAKRDDILAVNAMKVHALSLRVFQGLMGTALNAALNFSHITCV